MSLYSGSSKAMMSDRKMQKNQHTIRINGYGNHKHWCWLELSYCINSNCVYKKSSHSYRKNGEIDVLEHLVFNFKRKYPELSHLKDEILQGFNLLSWQIIGDRKELSMRFNFKPPEISETSDDSFNKNSSI